MLDALHIVGLAALLVLKVFVIGTVGLFATSLIVRGLDLALRALEWLTRGGR